MSSSCPVSCVVLSVFAEDHRHARGMKANGLHGLLLWGCSHVLKSQIIPRSELLAVPTPIGVGSTITSGMEVP